MECLNKTNEGGMATHIDANGVKRQCKEALMVEWSEERGKVNPDYLQIKCLQVMSTRKLILLLNVPKIFAKVHIACTTVAF